MNVPLDKLPKVLKAEAEEPAVAEAKVADADAAAPLLSEVIFKEEVTLEDEVVVMDMDVEVVEGTLHQHILDNLVITTIMVNMGCTGKIPDLVV